jgi:hypothetical protein
LAIVVSETNRCSGICRLEKDAPAIIGHLHEIEVGPTIWFNADCGPQVDFFLLEAFRPHLLPPLKIVWQPLLQRSLKFLVLGKVYVVRNAFVKVHDSF